MGEGPIENPARDAQLADWHAAQRAAAEVAAMPVIYIPEGTRPPEGYKGAALTTAMTQLPRPAAQAPKHDVLQAIRRAPPEIVGQLQSGPVAPFTQPPLIKPAFYSR